ncbi:MAG TPA: S41 family peptidase [Ruminococcus sp.]
MELTNKIINSFLALCASAALGAGGMYLYNKDKINSSDKYGLIGECESFLESQGVKLPEEADPKIAALNGYLEAYGDKYTFYSKTNNDESYLSAMNCTSCLVTCGYKVGLSRNGRIEVINVTAESIAEKQGLKTGDIILSIDGEVIAEKGIVPTAMNLSGKDGTTMNLVIEREGVKLPLEFVRSNDYDKSIESVDMKASDGILYISLSSFNEYTPALFFGKIEEISEDHKGIIIDLRNNAGGIVADAVTLADKFIGKAKVECFFYTGEVKTFETSDSKIEDSVPIVLLCNEKTASAAEVFAALLKQYGEDVKLVGTTTFGKGIFQLDKELSDGGNLHYTAGYYTVGDWECYHEIGIKPDVEVEMDSSFIGTDKDIQLEKAYEILG